MCFSDIYSFRTSASSVQSQTLFFPDQPAGISFSGSATNMDKQNNVPQSFSANNFDIKVGWLCQIRTLSNIDIRKCPNECNNCYVQ